MHIPNLFFIFQSCSKKNNAKVGNKDLGAQSGLRTSLRKGGNTPVTVSSYTKAAATVSSNTPFSQKSTLFLVKPRVPTELHNTQTNYLSPSEQKQFVNHREIKPNPQRDRVFNDIVKVAETLGAWDGAAGDVVINWLINKPAFTEGRYLRIYREDGQLGADIPAVEEAFAGSKKIYLMQEKNHYSPAKVKGGCIVKVIDTPRDGDCFFRAVISEIQRIKPGEVTKADIQAMRYAVARGIEASRAELEPFLI